MMNPNETEKQWENTLRIMTTIDPDTQTKMRKGFVVSIDIGTSRTGFAFRPPLREGSSSESIYCFSIDGEENQKGPSDIVFPAGLSNITEAIVGKEAIRLARENPNKYDHYVNYKKDLLANGGDPVPQCKSIATNGNLINTEVLFAAMLSKLRILINEKLVIYEKNNLGEEEIDQKACYWGLKNNVYFVILHPVIARSGYFKIIYQAIIESGFLGQERIEGQVRFFQEPISAALYMLYYRHMSYLPPHPHILVCDSGGGTTDCVALKFSKTESNLIELSALEPKGIDIGGSEVNHKILGAVARLITKNRYSSRIFDSQQSSLIGLMEQIEALKIVVTSEIKSSPPYLDFNLGWITKGLNNLLSIDKENLIKHVEIANKSTLGIKPWNYKTNNNLLINRDFVKNIIRKVSADIGTYITEYINYAADNDQPPFTNVLLVGGFTSSSIFQEEMRNRIDRLATLDRGSDGDIAVVLGGTCYSEFSFSNFSDDDSYEDSM